MMLQIRWKTLLLCYAVAALTGNADAQLVYVGSQGNQIRALRFDDTSGKLTVIGPAAEGLRPTWTIAHPQLPTLYAVNDDSTREGSVTAYAVNRATGALTKVNEVATGGNGTTYLWFDAPSHTILAANYAGGSTSSIAVNPDGSLGALVSTIKATGSGPHRRQASAHTHAVVVDPSGRYALVPDLGADRVFVYSFDRAAHALSADDAATPRSFAVPAGSGPRHLAFGADGHYVYLLNELTAELIVLRWDAQQGSLARVQTLQTSSPEFTGAKSGAEVAVSPDGRFVYVENRGENALLAYRVHPATGELTPAGRTASGGEAPWALAIHPSGKWMLMANQRSGKVNVFSIDPASGKVTDTGQSVDMPTPVSITFMPPN
jgi:6-phosphogluconolactonase